MEKIKKYEAIIVDYLTTFAKKSKLANMPDIENKVLVDKEQHSYQLMRIGWQGTQFVFSVVFHFDIKDGKVWFQRNITERDVLDVLMEKGIPKEDIVLGFRAPKIRYYTGFAVA